MAFLERGEGAVEVAGRKFAVVKKKRHLSIEDYHDRAEKLRRENFKNFRENRPRLNSPLKKQIFPAIVFPPRGRA
jgi:hypothetical protein